MISHGYLVQDWKGRAGITVDTCEAPESEELDESLERVVLHWGGTLRWWRVALFSGAIVKSPEQAMESWGPANQSVLQWAIRRAGHSISEQLSSIPQPGDNHIPGCCPTPSLPDQVAR